MKKESHILSKYLVIPVTFVALLVIMDFSGQSIRTAETMCPEDTFGHLSILSYRLIHIGNYTLLVRLSDQKLLITHKAINLRITPIFKKVKAYSSGNNDHYGMHYHYPVIIGHLFLPIVIIITGLLSLRTNYQCMKAIMIVSAILVLAYLLCF